jgi:PST family polysaccharide transporter
MARDNDRWLSTEHLAKRLGQRAARGAAFTLGAQGAKLLIGLLATAVLARLLTPREFGLVGMVTAITGMIGLFSDLGLSTATVQRQELTHEQVSSLFWVNVGLGFVLALITAVLAPVVAWFYGEPELVQVTLALAAGFVASSASVQHIALLRRSMLFGRVSLIQVLSQLGGALVAVALAAAGAGYWALVARALASPFLGILGFWAVCDWRPGLLRRSTPIRELLAFGGHVTGFSLLNYLARNADNVLIGRFHGTQELAIYQKGYDLFMMPLQQVNGPAGAVTVPALSRLASDPQRYRNAYLRILEKVTVLSTLLAAFSVGAAEWLVAVLLGEQWLGTASILRALGISALVQPVSNTTGWLFISQGRTKELFRWGVIGSGISLLSFVVGLPWGGLGVALAYGISGIVLRMPLLVWMVTRQGPIAARDILRTCLQPILASAVGLAVVLVASPWLRHLPAAVAAGVAGTLLVLTTAGVLSATPSGRASLRDFKSLAMELRGGSRSTHARSR